jgi:cellulose synthase/poly-beta-1,6-N-acetylglucosamine synthase-like glycosyltransferase
MIETIIIFISVFYFFEILLFTLGNLKGYKQKPAELPFISLIIAARNEEKNLPSCLESIVRLNYPKDKLEIIIVNDHSTDHTGEILSEYVNNYSHIKTFIPKLNESHLIGKANAIAQAIDISKGEYIFTTDADCILPADWLSETIKYYDDKTGIVCGFTYTEHDTFFKGMQSLDWLYLLTIASASFKLNIPLSCVGNNMSFRRKAYDEVGGFRGLPFSVTEDSALLLAIKHKTFWKCLFPFNRSSLVYSKACETYKQMIRQRKRWGTGGLHSPLSGFVLVAAGFLISGLMFLIPFLPLFNVSIEYILLPLITKVVLDLIFISIPLTFFGLLNLLKHFIFFEIYYTIYVFVLPFMVFFNKKVYWKDRVF